LWRRRQYRIMPPMPEVMVHWLSLDGTEHDERWPSIEAFRTWAAAERLRVSYRAYVQDEEGEWEVVEDGRIDGNRTTAGLSRMVKDRPFPG
jgi:hypothetical protein